MADDISVAVTGDREVAIRFDQFPDASRADLKAAITAQTDKLAARVRAAAPVKTGRLRSQITSGVFEDKDGITGEVYIDGDDGSQDYAKAGALEWGVHGTYLYRPHDAILKKLKSPASKIEGAYHRTVNIVARRFERGPLAEMSGDIEQALNDAVSHTVDRTE